MKWKLIDLWALLDSVQMIKSTPFEFSGAVYNTVTVSPQGSMEGMT